MARVGVGTRIAGGSGADRPKDNLRGLYTERVRDGGLLRGLHALRVSDGAAKPSALCAEPGRRRCHCPPVRTGRTAAAAAAASTRPCPAPGPSGQPARRQPALRRCRWR
eukprot:scaffold24337_cov101-Isochrysis_galbana.AAC.1